MNCYKLLAVRTVAILSKAPLSITTYSSSGKSSNQLYHSFIPFNNTDESSIRPDPKTFELILTEFRRGLLSRINSEPSLKEFSPIEIRVNIGQSNNNMKIFRITSNI